MSENPEFDGAVAPVPSFYDQPGVERATIPVAGGIPFGLACVANPAVGIGGAYGTWGPAYDNAALPGFIEARLGEPLQADEVMALAELGFFHRQLIAPLSPADDLELEVEVGARLLRAACQANGWAPGEVEGVLLGMSAPVAGDYLEQVARRAGIPERALKVSIHKACDSSVAGLNLALNPGLALNQRRGIAQALHGKKVLVGGVEGLSRFVGQSRDRNGLQLFGNGAGVIGLIPGQTMVFIVGQTHEAYDEEGVLAVRMFYPHSRRREPGQSLVELSDAGPAHLRVAGLMHEPAGDTCLDMAGMMGMVKLFVRSGVQVVTQVVQAYRQRMAELGTPDKTFAAAIVHHANFKINQLKQKHLAREGIRFPMPWLLREFGNVSAASNMIAFLRQLPSFKPGDHVLFDGFGAGTYYDVVAVALGG